MELVVEHVFNRIQFGFMVSFTGASFIIFSMVSQICSDCDLTRLLDVEDGKFPK